MKYYASYYLNNGSTGTTKPYEYTNKRQAIAEIKAMVAAEHFQQTGNISRYDVVDGNGIYVAAGSLYGKGQWMVAHDVIGTHVEPFHALNCQQSND